MQKVSGLSSLIDFYVYDNRKKYLWSQYVKVAENIAAAVNNVHDSGHIIGDLNPNNFMLDVNTGRVMLVDTDSYHIKSKLFLLSFRVKLLMKIMHGICLTKAQTILLLQLLFSGF